MEIKLMAIFTVVIAIVTGIVTYEFTSNHYEAIISAEHEQAALIVKQKTEDVLAAERKNNETTELLNRKAFEQDKIINGLQNQLANLRTVNNGLRIQSKCISSTSTTPNSPSSDFNSTTTRTTEGVCELPAMFADTITETARAADDMRGRLLICKEYAEAIDEQRKRMYNDNKQQ